MPWATQYSNPLAATPDFGVPRHPAQLYDALLALGMFLVLRTLPRRLPDGTRAAAFLVLYGAGRVLLGPLRLDPQFLFGLQSEQLLALAAVVFGIVFGFSPLLGRVRRSVRAETGARGAARAKEDSMAA